MNSWCTESALGTQVTPAVNKQLDQVRDINMSMTRRQLRFCNAAISAIAAFSLTACGGGGDGGPVAAAGAGGQTAPAPATSAAFMVNTTTAGVQDLPDLARLTDGGHVVVWSSNISAGTTSTTAPGDRAVCTQRYQAGGAAAGVESCITSDVVNRVRGPSVAALADGGYVLAWTAALDGTFFSKAVLSQLYDANGAAIGSVQQVNAITDSQPLDVNAAALPGGGYVLAWTRLNNAAAVPLSVAVRRFGADGLAASPEETVSAGFITGMTALTGGGYVIARSDPSDALLVTRYDNQGAQVGPEISVASIGGNHSAITGLAGGGFAVGWRSPSGVIVQRFASDGSLAGPPTPVDSPVPMTTCFNPSGSSACPSLQDDVAIAAMEDGGYVATWLADPATAIFGAQKVFARRFAADGTAAGPVIAVSSEIGFVPKATALPGGSVAIAWTQGFDIFERRLDAQTLLTGTTP
jgi:hypothetical protein